MLRYLSNGGGITAAEPRPNAYLVDTVPDSNTSYGFSSSSQQTTRTIPVPKPYGSMAPFKPQQAGSSMRHIRKPKMKPLEL